MTPRRCDGAESLRDVLRSLCAVAALAASACGGPAPEKADAPAPRPVVVLSIWDGPREVPSAPIQGTLACTSPIDLDPLCIGDDLRLAETVLQCGSPEATIDRSWSHVRYVHFPAGLHERFEAIPSDLDIVRCVRGRVGFRFAAGIARDSTELVEADRQPFTALHAPAR